LLSIGKIIGKIVKNFSLRGCQSPLPPFLFVIYLSYMKFIITEQERIHIRNLYEQTATKDMYSTLVGYLVKLGEDGGKKGIRGLEDITAIKDARMYFESLRDGISPQKLSDAAEFVKSYAMTETKKLSGEELYSLKELGKTNQTKI